MPAKNVTLSKSKFMQLEVLCARIKLLKSASTILTWKPPISRLKEQQSFFILRSEKCLN